MGCHLIATANTAVETNAVAFCRIEPEQIAGLRGEVVGGILRVKANLVA